jgi:hypothetical protein
MLASLRYGAAARASGDCNDKTGIETIEAFALDAESLSPHMVRDNYQKMLKKCRLREGELPTPRMMQELVTLWKVLWIWPK